MSSLSIQTEPSSHSSGPTGASLSIDSRASQRSRRPSFREILNSQPHSVPYKVSLWVRNRTPSPERRDAAGVVSSPPSSASASEFSFKVDDPDGGSRATSFTISSRPSLRSKGSCDSNRSCGTQGKDESDLEDTISLLIRLIKPHTSKCKPYDRPKTPPGCQPPTPMCVVPPQKVSSCENTSRPTCRSCENLILSSV